MSGPFAFRPLTRETIPLAYPLLQATAAISLEQWSEYARARTASDGPRIPDRRGIMCAEDTNGYIHGLLAYRVSGARRGARTLACENLVAMHFVDDRRVRATLIRGIDWLGRHLECAAVRLHLADGRSVVHELTDGAVDLIGETLREAALNAFSLVPDGAGGD